MRKKRFRRVAVITAVASPLGHAGVIATQISFARLDHSFPQLLARLGNGPNSRRLALGAIRSIGPYAFGCNKAIRVCDCVLIILINQMIQDDPVGRRELAPRVTSQHLLDSVTALARSRRGLFGYCDQVGLQTPGALPRQATLGGPLDKLIEQCVRQNNASSH
jgi:hypothetical protein